MKSYKNNEESSYIQYLDANNLYGWAMSEKLPTNGFKWIDNNEINEDFIKNYNENGTKGYIFEVDVEYPKRLHELHSDLLFLSERMEVNKCKKLVCNLFNKEKYVAHINTLKQALNRELKLEKIHRIIEFIEYPKRLHELHSDLPFLSEQMEVNKCKKLVCNLFNKEKYVVHINTLKQALNHGLKLEKIHRIIEFNQEAWLKPYIDMNTELRKEAKNNFEKYLFKLMNNSIFGKTMEKIRKHRDIKLVKTDKKRNKLVSEPNYDIINLISEDLSIIEMKKTKVKMNKPIYLGLSILEISKTLMYEFWYDYMKPKYNNDFKLCYMDTDSFIMNIKTNAFYKDISNDIENRFDTSNYEVNRPLPTGKNKKIIGLMKDELGGRIITEFVTLRPKTYSFLTDDRKEDKKAK